MTERKKWYDMAGKDKDRYRQEITDYRYRQDKEEENESSPPNDKDTEEKGANNDRTSETNKVSWFGNLSKLEQFPPL